MIKYFIIFINWVVCLFKKPGTKLTFTISGRTINAYLFEPPVFKNKKSIVACHGGWSSISTIPKMTDICISRYVYSGYTVLFLRYEDEFTPAPTDLNLDNDTKDIDASVLYLRSLNKYTKFFLMGSSRGGFAVLQTMTAYWKDFDACVACCAPSDIPALESFPTMHTILSNPGLHAYFYQWSSPITKIDQLKNKPLVLVHGKDDDVVPVGQSVNLAYAINKINGRVALNLVSGVGHGVSSDSSAMKYINDKLDAF